MRRPIAVAVVMAFLGPSAPYAGAEHLVSPALIQARLKAHAAALHILLAHPSTAHAALQLRVELDALHPAAAVLTASDWQAIACQASRLEEDPLATGPKASTVAFIAAGLVVLWLGLALIGYAVVGGS